MSTISKEFVFEQFGVKIQRPLIPPKVGGNINNMTEDDQIKAIRDDPMLIRNLEKPSRKLCRLAINYNPHVIQYIKNSCEHALCDLAVTRDPTTLKYHLSVSRTVAKKILKRNGMLLEYMNRWLWLHELVLIAVQQNGLALQFAHDRSQNICVAAVLQNEDAIQFVPDDIKTDEFYISLINKYPHYWNKVGKTILNMLAAIAQNAVIVLWINPSDIITYFDQIINANSKVASYLALNDDQRKKCLDIHPNALLYLQQPTYAEKLYAIQQHPSAIALVSAQSEEQKMAAINGDGMNIKYIEEPTSEMKNAAIMQNPMSILNISGIESSHLLIAVDKNPSLIKQIDSLELTLEAARALRDVYALAVAKDGMLLEFIPTPDDQLIEIALTQNSAAIQFVPEPSLAMQLMVITRNPANLKHIKCQSIEACKRAVSLNPMTIKYISAEVWDDLEYLKKYDK